MYQRFGVQLTWMTHNLWLIWFMSHIWLILNPIKAIRNNEIHRHRVSLEELKSMGPRISSSHGRKSRPSSGQRLSAQPPTTAPANMSRVDQSESSIWQGRTSKANKKLKEAEKKSNEKMLEEVILFSDNGTIYRGAQWPQMTLTSNGHFFTS